jgi:zinc transport system substrate-binding protein
MKSNYDFSGIIMRRIVALVVIIGLIATSVGCGYSRPVTAKLKVVTSTSQIAQIVERVGEGRVDVINLIPPTQCPEDFSLMLDDLKIVANADLLLFHHWQEEQFHQHSIDSTDNLGLNIAKINVQGNWMIPEIQLMATNRITEILVQVDSENGAFYEKNAARYQRQIQKKEAQLRDRLNDEQLKELYFIDDLTAVNAICTESAVEFVEWTGINVIATYGKPDSVTPEVVEELKDFGRSNGAWVVIDNYQCSKNAGAEIASALGVPSIILTSSPIEDRYIDTWEQSIDHNIGLIVNGLDVCPLCI